MATLTDSLLNGVKSLFSGLGAKTTDSNYAVPLVNKNDATPTGYMTMANIAAVLGAANIMAKSLNCRVTETSSGKLENLTTGIVYCANPGNLDDAPSGFAEGPTVFIYLGLSGTPRGVQIGFNCSNSSVMKIAMRGQLYSGWTAWKSITLT